MDRTTPILHEHLNEKIVRAEYAVRGDVVKKAGQIAEELKNPNHTYPFQKTVMCNIGNPQALGQKPITFFRQVIAACNYPPLAYQENEFIPADARRRAIEILTSIGQKPSVGAYTHSQGLECVRKDIASFLLNRDGIPSSLENIFVTDGASSAVKACLQLFCAHPSVGVLIPIPQYPLYSASVTICDAHMVPYYLCEEDGWAIHSNELENSINKAKSEGIDVRILCVINPGNPTGQCLPIENMKKILEICQKNNIIIFADEVYQENVYDQSTPFHSFRKVYHEMGLESSNVQIVSFHSTSKGVLGECGYRGGFMEFTGFEKKIIEEMYKLMSISLCSNVNGQVMVSLMVNPPKLGDESYSLYKQEVQDLHDSLKRRALLVSEVLNKIEGIKCNPISGALYAFPQIEIPPKAVEEANKLKKSADLFFATELLNSTGICIVPGSGFGQKDGTWHFRTTILPPEDEMSLVLKNLSEFYTNFRNKYLN